MCVRWGWGTGGRACATGLGLGDGPQTFWVQKVCGTSQGTFRLAHGEAAVYGDGLTGDEAGVVAGEVADGRGDVLGDAQAL